MFGKCLFLLVNTSMAAIAFPDYFYIGLIYSLLILMLFRSRSQKTLSPAQSSRCPSTASSAARRDENFDPAIGAATLMAGSSAHSWDYSSTPATDDNYFESSNYSDSFESTIDINPATGLTMIDGIGGVDVGDNLYGCSGFGSWDSGISGIDDSWSSGSSGIDDW